MRGRWDRVTDALDPVSIIQSAQKAADAGDYPTAERLLREAATIQEATLGSMDPELATTLNNYAFVCERTNNIAEAERGYRRAHAIAVASLGPRHPFVATSIKNLVGFCATHGIPIWKPPVVQPQAETEIPDSATETPETETATPDVDSAPEGQSQLVPIVVGRWRPLAFGAIALAAVLVAAVVLTTRREPQIPPPSSAPAPSSVAPAPTLEVQPAVAAPEPEPPQTPPPAERQRSRPMTAMPQTVTVANAQLCKALARRGSPDWQCTSADGDLQPGTFFFYTRLLASANTTVEHRWYRGERVHQVMRLRVAAAPGSGYRTFSSNTVSAERAGDWKVELRAADGTVLQEQRFVIRLP
jgi:hypothetical protein